MKKCTMKNVYDVAKSSSLVRQTPRVVQVHLKSQSSLEEESQVSFDFSSSFESEFLTNCEGESRETADEERETTLQEESIDIQSTDLSLSNSTIEEVSVHDRKLHTSRESLRRNSDVKQKTTGGIDVHRNIANWLSFPTAMRNALLYSGSNSREERSFTDIQYDSAEDLGLRARRASDSASMFGRNSVRGSFRSRSVKLDVNPLQSGGEVWPKGKFSVVKEKTVSPRIWQNSYTVKWKDENTSESSSATDIVNHEDGAANSLVGKSWETENSSHKGIVASSDVSSIYGNSLNGDSKSKVLNKFVPACCV